jgi:hypothetical protein
MNNACSLTPSFVPYIGYLLFISCLKCVNNESNQERVKQATCFDIMDPPRELMLLIMVILESNGRLHLVTLVAFVVWCECLMSTLWYNIHHHAIIGFSCRYDERVD